MIRASNRVPGQMLPVGARYWYNGGAPIQANSLSGEPSGGQIVVGGLLAAGTGAVLGGLLGYSAGVWLGNSKLKKYGAIGGAAIFGIEGSIRTNQMIPTWFGALILSLPAAVVAGITSAVADKK